MNDFNLYFSTGWRHILSWDALDHLLFITALAAIYLPVNWKQVLILITAFTIGHSVTLALSVFDIIKVSNKWVEFLIPCTIVATAVFNCAVKKYDAQSLRFNYLLALFFGLVHGMGFASSIRFMLSKDQQITIPLLGFNTGLEAGQIVVVSFILLCSYLLVNKMGLKRNWWVWALSGISAMVALQMCVERWPF